MDNALNSIQAIFAEAIRQPDAGQRAAYLAIACGDDARLRSRVEALLAAHERAGSFMQSIESPADAATADHRAPMLDTDAPTETPGSLIGRYKLLQQIGEGGFGVVYMADQEQPVKRRVALKIIKAGMDTRAVIARFEAERQALAMMDHPNIARVLDAGATDAGRPYFVMELVKGIPITEYCDQANLDMRQRLELFMDVCRAVQHAHQKGVIHRDLKPSNIMVTLHDAKPVVKVIDFGIAKATDQKLTEKTLFTSYGQMIGTPAYMSPEQAVMSGLDVDTRSDVYALGVLLYELLTGSPPFDAHTLRSAGFDEMRRIIREEQPQKPSTKLSTLAEDARLMVAAQRHASPAALSKQLHGDLDWIILKAIEKDRSRRYESASAFAQDIKRHLNSEPVLAAAPSAGYKLRKFMRRNKAPMAAAAAIAGLLLGGTAVSTWQAIVATHAKGVAIAAVAEKDKALIAEAAQRRLAESNGTKAMIAASQAQAANAQAQKRLAQIEKANEILGSIFENLDPKEIARQDRPLQAILVEKLDQAVGQLEGESIGDPLVVAAMQKTFGTSLIGLGEPRKAIVLLEKARATFQAKLGPDAPYTLGSMNNLALAYRDAGRPELALPLLEKALMLRKNAGGPLDVAALAAMNNLAQLYLDSGKRELGIPLFEETLKLARATLGPDDIGTLTTTSNLALAYMHAGEAGRALPLFGQTVKISKARFGTRNPQTLICMDNLAGAYEAVGRMEEAVALYEEALRLERVVLGIDHLDTLTTMSNLAGAYRDAKMLDLALPLNEETLRLMTARFGRDHSHTVACMDNLARAYQAAGKLDLAIPLFEETIKLEKVVFGPDDANTLTSMSNLAVAYWKTNQFEKSVPLYEQILKIVEPKYGRDDELTLKTIACLGQNYKDAGRLDEAMPLLEEAHRAAKKYPELQRFRQALLEGYGRQGKTEKATALANEMLAEARKTSPGDERLRAGELASRSRPLLEKKAFAEAEPLLRECLVIRQKIQPTEWTTFNTQSMLGAALLGQKKYAEAEPLLLDGYEGLSEAKIFPPARDRLAESLQRLVTLYESRGGDGDTEKAAKYRKLLEQAKESVK